MTPDEVTAYQEAAITTQQQIQTSGFGDKLRAYIESIPTVHTPTVPPKIGFKWKLIYRGIAGFAWELVPDPDAVGTVAKPFEWLRESVLLWDTTIPTALTLRLPLRTAFLQPLMMKGF